MGGNKRSVLHSDLMSAHYGNDIAALHPQPFTSF